ncbi:hypothetical protein DFH06DRAFT_326481 [Mycena polygramma]|nr:hypothetical protein DFH06DRAFT_326481 [Mycena polygramma]
MRSNFRSLLLLTTLAATLAPALGQLSSACFTGGTVGDCSPFIIQFCTNVAQNKISGSDTMSQCFNTPGGLFRCDFTTINTLSLVESPDATNCQTALTTISENCPMGGDGMFDGRVFQFVIDPNEGSCGLPCGD